MLLYLYTYNFFALNPKKYTLTTFSHSPLKKYTLTTFSLSLLKKYTLNTTFLALTVGYMIMSYTYVTNMFGRH